MPAESAGYVKHRLRVAGATAEVFTPGALREIHRLSGGIPRIINVICDRALLGAFTQEEHRIGGKLVRRAAGEVFGRPVAAPWLRLAVGGAIVAGLALVGVGLWLLLGDRLALPRQQPAASAPAPVVATEQAAAPVAPISAPVVAPAAPALDELLAQHGNDTTTESALWGLFDRWGAEYKPASGKGCDQAVRQGLECLFQKGSWAQLRTLNRPAILTLTDDVGRTHQVLLVGLTDETASIDLGGQLHEVPITAMSRYWFGDFLLLWRPPMAVAKSLTPGMRGEDVRWLRQSLQSAQGMPETRSPANDLYDEDLVRLVQDFQRQHRLNVDGVAGVQTQIVLDTVLNATGSPTIVGPVAGG
jgi:general secretion pathway protein A